MRKTRIKTFRLNDKTEYIDFGIYAIIMYYVKELNFVQGKKLFDCTLTEYFFRKYNQLPVENDLSSEDDTSHFIMSEIQEVIEFINDDILPALNSENEEVDLVISKYGGIKPFIDLFYSNPEYLIDLCIDENEIFEGSGPQLAFTINRLKLFLEYAISLNQSFKVFV